jgi:protein-L-isoaspartate O-methyltransferase
VTDPASLLRRMVDDLSTDGALQHQWREIFHAVPRHTFIPELVWHRGLSVALMLAALQVTPRMRVCELGTGYNAALLAQRLGADHVTTIEVDPALATQVRRALSATGYGDVTVITGDGTHGYPPHAPYDRILSTAAVQRVPYEQQSSSWRGTHSGEHRAY